MDAENARKAKEFIARYPEGRQISAVIPLLDLAQRQVGAETNTQGWLPIPVMEFVAKELDTSYIRVLEVATFYTMFNLAPVGRFHVQVCGTTPCMLRGSDDVFAACAKRGLKKGNTTEDGLFTLTEVECLGACANAPMVQINDDNYEDLTEESMGAILDALARGEHAQAGSAGSTARPAAPKAARPPSRRWPSATTTIARNGRRRREKAHDRAHHRSNPRHPADWRSPEDREARDHPRAVRRHRDVRAEQAWDEAAQMTIVAIIVAVVLAFLAFRFVVGIVKFAVLAVIVLVALFLAHQAGAF